MFLFKKKKEKKIVNNNNIIHNITNWGKKFIKVLTFESIIALWKTCSYNRLKRSVYNTWSVFQIWYVSNSKAKLFKISFRILNFPTIGNWSKIAMQAKKKKHKNK